MKPWLQTIIPQKLLTDFFGWLATIQTPWFKNWAIQTFSDLYGVSLSEAIKQSPDEYKNFHAFFTRALRENTRPIDQTPHTIVAPADGILSQIGKIKQGSLLQAKGHTYSVDELLTPQCQACHAFSNGYSFTVYLAPHNYHRVHMPCDGVLKQMIYVPGKLFSVNLDTAAKIPKLFAQNERVICLFETELGQMAVILVGAMIVASIQTTWAGTINSQRTAHIKTWTYPTKEQRIFLQKGEELGSFSLGSTVIVLLEQEIFPHSIAFAEEIKMGSTLAQTSKK